MTVDDVIGAIEACDKDIVVRAGAGSGKTTALVRKYITELNKRRDDGYARVDQLAAITFTEKAAAEMSGRVREKLTELIEELKRKTSIKGSSASLDQCKRERGEDEKLLAHLIEQRQTLNSAYISTIHSFCARLLWENPLVAGVDPAFRVIDEMESAELMEASAQTVIMRRLRSGVANVKKLVRDFGFGSGGPYAKGLKDYILWMIPLVRAANMSPAKLAWLHKQKLESLEAGREAAISELRKLAVNLCGYREASKEYKTGTALVERGDLESESVDVSVAVAGEMLELAEDFLVRVGARKSVKEGKRTDEQARRARDLVNHVYGAIIERELARDMGAMVSLLNDIMDEYSREKHRRSAIDYEDLEEKARDLLKNSPTILQAYKSRFVRVLIDEFQDTNELQREIVTTLAAPGEGRLFIVGDVKQSIYGFRGADVDVFMRVAEDVVANGGEEFILRHSGRSVPELTDFSNRFFATLMDGLSGGFLFDPEKDSLEPDRDSLGDGVCVDRIITRPGVGADQSRGMEAAALAEYIINAVGAVKVADMDDGAVRGAKYGDMVILLRTLSSHKIYETALRREGIPYQVVKGRGFFDSQEIRDFVNLLVFLDFSSDKLALVSTLRSPLVGLSDYCLMRLCAPGVLSYVLHGAKAPSCISGPDMRRLEDFAWRVKRWRRIRGRVMISELLEMILSETGYGPVMMSRQNGEQTLANIHKLIELARVFEADGSRGLKNFITRLKTLLSEKSKEPDADITGGGDVVRIMTVHQSKGLEFPLVFIADLGFDPPSHTGNLAFHPGKGLGLKSYDIQGGKWYAGPMYNDTRKEEAKARSEEIKRLLYVAVTRARDRLILSGPGEGKGQWRRFVDDSIADAGLVVNSVTVDNMPVGSDVEREEDPPVVKRIIEGFAPEDGMEEPFSLQSGLKPSLQISVTDMVTFSRCPRLYYYRRVMELPLVSPETALEKTGKRFGSIKYGSRVHELLEAAPMGRGVADDAIESTARVLLPDMPDDMRTGTVGLIRRVFSMPPLSRLGRVDPGDIWREAPVAHRIVGKDIDITLHGATDLVWVDRDGYHLVDYKYSTRPKDERSHIFQLKLYAHAFLQAYGMDSIQTAVVYIREKSTPITPIRFLSIDSAGIRDHILTSAARLSGLEGRPETDWPLRDKNECKSVGCFFVDRCHGKSAIGRKPRRKAEPAGK